MSEKNDNHAKNYHELSGKEGHEKIAELVKGIHICHDDDGWQGRDDEQPAHGGAEHAVRRNVVVSDASDSEKVDEMEQDQHVTLTFAEPTDSKYITLKGRATVTQDRAKVQELWNPMYKAWFPKGEEDPEIAVMRVDVTEGDLLGGLEQQAGDDGEVCGGCDDGWVGRGGRDGACDGCEGSF